MSDVWGVFGGPWRLTDDVDPWTELWTADAAELVERRPPPPGQWPMLGPRSACACVNCPGVADRRCCQHEPDLELIAALTPVWRRPSLWRQLFRLLARWRRATP